jgi:hypothetical protein
MRRPYEGKSLCYGGVAEKLVKKFYDMKIRCHGPNGRSRYLTVTKLLPKDWDYVRVWQPKIKGNKAWIVIECLYKTGEVVENAEK